VLGRIVAASTAHARRLAAYYSFDQIDSSDVCDRPGLASPSEYGTEQRSVPACARSLHRLFHL